MAADNDGPGPARYHARYVLADNRFTEHGSIENITDRAVGGAPHFLQVVFFDALFIGCDGGAFNADPVFFDGFRRIDGHLIIGVVTVRDTEVMVIELYIEIGQDQLVLDESPDDPSHLVTV